MAVPPTNEFFGSDWFKEISSQNGEKFAQNVKLLSLGLNKNEHYIAKDGRLYVRSHKSILDKIKYSFQRSTHEKAVKELIGQTVTPLTNNVDAAPQEALRNFFFEKMAKLPQKIFDRKVLSKELTYVLSPELKAAREKVGDLKIEGDSYYENMRVELRIEQTRLAINLGVDLKRISAGKSGAYFAKTFKGKTIGVFKPGAEESLGANSPKLSARIAYVVKKKILHMDPGAPFWGNEGYLAEGMTSKLSQHLGLTTVPASQVTTLKSGSFGTAKKGPVEEIGSFQLFVPKAKSADEILKLKSQGAILGRLRLKLNTWRYKDQISEKVRQGEFEQMALLDISLANRDRHYENWMLTRNDNQYHINLIDHQLSFPRYNPPKSDRLYRRNQYKWANLPQAQEKFSDDLKATANEKFKGENLRQLLKDLNDVSNLKRDFEGQSSQELAFKERVAVLLKGMELGYTIKQLAEIKSDEDIKSFLQKNKIIDLDQYLELT